MFVTRKKAEIEAANAAAGGGVLGVILGAVMVAIPAILKLKDVNSDLWVAREERDSHKALHRQLMEDVSELSSYDVREMSAGSLRHHMAEKMADEDRERRRSEEIEAYKRHFRDAERKAKDEAKARDADNGDSFEERV